LSSVKIILAQYASSRILYSFCPLSAWCRASFIESFLIFNSLLNSRSGVYGATSKKCDGDAWTSFVQIPFWPIKPEEMRFLDLYVFACRLSISTRGVDMFDANNHWTLLPLCLSVSAASLCLGESTCTQVEWLGLTCLVMDVFLVLWWCLDHVWMMTYIWNTCHVRMQTTDVAYRTWLEVQLGLVFSFSGKAPLWESVLRYGGVTSALEAIFVVEVINLIPTVSAALHLRR
jgi:hypothetical protein